MHVASFYSYKGGVGRTVCLLNVAWELALRGKRVALMDLDLEAPGLHQAHLLRRSTTGRKAEKEQWEPVGQPTGLMQSFTEWMERVDKKTEMSTGIELPLITGLGPGQRIALLPAGRNDSGDVDETYQKLLHRFNWATFYHKPYFGRTFLEKVIDYLEGQGYEHLLVDARTGLTDVRYVTTIHLPDLVVLVTNLTEQSLRGTREQIQRIESINKECRRKERGSPHRRPPLERTPIDTLIVASPMPLGEWAIREERLNASTRLLRGHSIDVVVDHLPILAYREGDQILDQRRKDPWAEDSRRSGPAAPFSEIADAILRRAAASAENLNEAGKRMFRAGRWREASAFFDAAVDMECNADRGDGATAARAEVGLALAQLQGLAPEAVRPRLDRISRQVLAKPSLPVSRYSEVAEVWLAMSWSYVLKEDYKQAAKTAHEATNLIKEKGNHDLRRLEAFAWYVEGDARTDLGELHEACERLQTADEIYRTLPGVYAEQAMVLGRLAVALTLLGKLRDADGKLQDARERLERVLLPQESESHPEKRLWAGLREAEGELHLARGDVIAAADTFAKIEKALRGTDTVGHLNALSRLYHLHARYGVKLEDSTSAEFQDLAERAADLRVPQVAVSVWLDQAMHKKEDPDAVETQIGEIGRKVKTRIAGIDLRKAIVRAWGALARGQAPDAQLLQTLDEYKEPENYELRFERHLVRALAAHAGTETENWQSRTVAACEEAGQNELWLWYVLLWIATGRKDSPDVPPHVDLATVGRILMLKGKEKRWLDLQEALSHRYRSRPANEV